MIRVLIERRLAAGQEEAFRDLMRAMRREAVHAEGYISGETLQDQEDPRHYVIISTWRSRADWDAWAASAAREAVRESILPLLEEAERVTLLEPV